MVPAKQWGGVYLFERDDVPHVYGVKMCGRGFFIFKRDGNIYVLLMRSTFTKMMIITAWPPPRRTPCVGRRETMMKNDPYDAGERAT
jgi:hypothetical protein